MTHCPKCGEPFSREQLARHLRFCDGMVSPAAAPEPRIYIASKTRHARRWQLLAAAGVPICSTWIHEAGAGETKDWTELWARCVREASTATALILYREADDEILKGAYLELGAALASGVPCWCVGPDAGNVTKNGALRRVGSINEALVEIIGPADPGAHGQNCPCADCRRIGHLVDALTLDDLRRDSQPVTDIEDAVR